MPLYITKKPMYIHMEAVYTHTHTHTHRKTKLRMRVFREAFTDEVGLELNFKGRQNFKKEEKGCVISHQVTPLAVAQNRAKHGTS